MARCPTNVAGGPARQMPCFAVAVGCHSVGRRDASRLAAMAATFLIRSESRDRHLQVSGFPSVRGSDRARPGRPARPGPVGAGPVTLMVDGIRVAEHTCVVALGI